jgi:hypothetical protein
MKKNYYLYGILTLILIFAIPSVTLAQDNPSGGDGSVNVDASATTPPPVPPGMPGSIRDRIRTDIQTHMKDMQNNQNFRNAMLERNASTTGDNGNGNEDGGATSTRRFPPMMHPGDEGMRGRFATSTMMGTSTMMNDEGRGENNGRDMRFEMFRMRKDFISRQLQTALNNLTQVRTRIDARIQKEQTAGRDMSTAISLLATADTKISLATGAVNALAAYLPSASSTVTATTTINLDTARQLAAAAQNAIRDAQRSLNDVIVAIAHGMGLKLGDDNHNATSTQEESGGTTVTATTTASTTSQ